MLREEASRSVPAQFLPDPCLNCVVSSAIQTSPSNSERESKVMTVPVLFFFGGGSLGLFLPTIQKAVSHTWY